MSVSRPWTGRRRIAAVALVAGVLAVHLPLADRLLAPAALVDAGRGAPERLKAVFVRELQPTAPSAAVPAPPPEPVLRRAALPPWPAASAAPLAPQEALAREAPAVAPPTPLTVPDLPALAAVAPSATPSAEPASAAIAAAPAFEWPPSTELSYQLTGDYRGPVEGAAQVRWVREGQRYQVHLDVAIGPSFAPLVQRRMSSDGVLTEAGLRPLRYDEETQIALRSPRRATIVLDDLAVRLPSGAVLPRPEGVQDTASQFVQMTWMFLRDPARLVPGRTVDMPLALPRRVDLWVYDVLGTERLVTPAGEVETVHLKPRREARAGSDLTAELWVAPTLQYLPVRIVIRQDASTFVDLLIDRLPRQALPAGAEASTPPR